MTDTLFPPRLLDPASSLDKPGTPPARTGRTEKTASGVLGRSAAKNQLPPPGLTNRPFRRHRCDASISDPLVAAPQPNPASGRDKPGTPAGRAGLIEQTVPGVLGQSEAKNQLPSPGLTNRVSRGDRCHA